jgi:uncharacterized protein (DUF433 family)
VATTAADVKTEYPHIVRQPGVVGGRPRIEGTRLPVWQIALAVHKGASVAELLDMYPDLTPAAVHSALAYNWDHKEEVDREIEAHRPEHVLADLRRDPHLLEVQPGVFRHKTSDELAQP